MTSRRRPSGGDAGRVTALTGATGFVGGALLNQLLNEGGRVRALARPRKGRALPSGGADWIAGDIGDPAALERLVEGARTVVHIAGATKARDEDAFHRANTAGAGRIAAAARRAGVEHFIHVSSLAARRPELSAYARSKAASETAVRVNFGAEGLTIVRPPAVIGPGDPATEPFMRMLRSGFLVAPAGDRAFSLLYVNDLAALLADLARAEAPLRSGVLEPSSLARVTWPELAACAGTQTGRRVRMIRIPGPLLTAAGVMADAAAAISGRPVHLSSGKVRELLADGWVCETELARATALGDCLKAAMNPDAARSGRVSRAGE